MKHLMSIGELTRKEIWEILNIADQLKFERQNGIKHPHLKGKTLGMIFDKASSGTRISFEVGMYDLGGHALVLPNESLSDGQGESVYDSAAVLSRFVDCTALKISSHSEAMSFAEGSGVPVINAMTDYSNPCQALADMMTIREYMGSFEGRKLCFAGSGATAASVITAAIKMGMEVSVACAPGREPDPEIVRFARENGAFSISAGLEEAARYADVIYTGAWSAPEDSAYTVNESTLAAAKSGAIVLHCLPVHRDEEIAASVFSSHSKEIYDQAENRLHVQKAVLVKLLCK